MQSSAALTELLAPFQLVVGGGIIQWLRYGEFEEAAPYEAGQILSQKLTEYGNSRGGSTPKGTPETVQLAVNLTDATSGPGRRQGSAA
eukprot:2785628-Amphidinium_carterae.1